MFADAIYLFCLNCISSVGHVTMALGKGSGLKKSKASKRQSVIGFRVVSLRFKLHGLGFLMDASNSHAETAGNMFSVILLFDFTHDGLF